MIYYELSVLAKSIHFKNLSAAAMHVGLSQPQLSRIIGKIEEELKVVLLDRTAKRKSGWTAVAFQLSEIFEKSSRRLGSEIQQMSNNQMVAELRIGTLEGLSNFALKSSRACFEHLNIKKISLDIFDLSDLEAHFVAGDLDLVFTSKIPGRQKFKNLIELGSQQLEKVETNNNYIVLSTFEYGRSNKKEIETYPHILVSNSLAIRKFWLESPGGVGFVPSETKRGKSRDNEPVYLIGSELLSPLLWKEIESSVS